ncbi:nuclear transport factor 2 family protein [Nocardia brasiliensis]
MGLSENKDLVRRYFELYSSGRLDEAFALLADDCTWWQAGDPARTPGAGTKTKAEIVDLFSLTATLYPHGMATTPLDFTAEGDRVAVEAESRGDVTNGKVYHNKYHFLFEVRGDKIHAVREYMDTQHVADTFADLAVNP